MIAKQMYALGLLVFATSTAWAQAAVASPAAAMPWKVLELSAHKLIVSATPRVEASLETVAAAAAELVAPQQGTPLEVPQDGALRLETSTTLLGRTFETQLWMDPADGNALQLLETETGAKSHRRLSRFCATGVFEETRLPADSTEAAAAPASWSQVTIRFIAFPSEKKGPVLGPAGLLWLLTGPQIGKPGDRAVAQVWAKGQLEDATVQATGTSALGGFSVIGPGGTLSSGTVETLAVTVSAAPVDPAASSNLELMGLQGDLKVSLDPTTRAPIELDGSVPKFGSLTVHLVSVEVPGAAK